MTTFSRIRGTGTSLDDKDTVVVVGLDPATGNAVSPGGGSGGGGGPATVADGANTAQGSVGDTAWSGSGNATEVAILKALALFLLNGTGKVNQRKTTLVDDSIRTAPDQAATAGLSSVPASITSGQLVAALAKSSSVTGRLGLIIVNDSASAILYIAYAATASLTAYTAKILPGVTWEMPSPIYGGLVSGIWDAAVGNARITELS